MIGIRKPEIQRFHAGNAHVWRTEKPVDDVELRIGAFRIVGFVQQAAGWHAIVAENLPVPGQDIPGKLGGVPIALPQDGIAGRVYIRQRLVKIAACNNIMPL